VAGLERGTEAWEVCGRGGCVRVEADSQILSCDSMKWIAQPRETMKKTYIEIELY
jgi:hypothetical protein